MAIAPPVSLRIGLSSMPCTGRTRSHARLAPGRAACQRERGHWVRVALASATAAALVVTRTYDHAITRAELKELMASSVRQMLQDAPSMPSRLRPCYGA